MLGPVGTKLGRFGVRGRLLLAFLGISGFALIAAAAGLFSLGQVGTSLERVTDERVPQALGWLDLSRQAERIVRAAPTLLIVESQSEREAVAERISAEVVDLSTRLEGIAASAGIGEAASTPRIGTMVDALGSNLVALDELVRERLDIAARKRELLRRLGNQTKAANRAVAPGVLLIESKLVDWKREAAGGGDKVAELDPEQEELARTLVSLLPQLKVEGLIAAINDHLIEIATAGSTSEAAVLEFPLLRALENLEKVMADLPAVIQRRLERVIEEFRNLSEGPDSVAALRREELAVLQRAEEVLEENVQVSAALTEAVDGLVADANQEIRAARSDAAAVQRFSSGVLIGVVILSLLSSGLIVWRYVHRNLISRLTGLSRSMLAIAHGDLRAPLPAAEGGDEIAEMASALAVFRDTAVEVEEKNLRQIAHARQRLIDAIESISEGFAFFDADDRLEMCNTRYLDFTSDPDRKLIRPGMKFADIARATAEAGVIETGAQGVEGYVAERIAHHSAPGLPQLRRLGDGRWVQISERQVDSGGTVATYSDLTELKQREAELDELVAQLRIAREHAELANEAKGAFLANVSHELRTPLTSILGFARLIQSRFTRRILPEIQSDDARTKRAVKQIEDNLEIILAEGRRLTTLINNVLDLEKIAAGKMEWAAAPVAMRDVVEQAHAATEALFAQKGLELGLDVADGLPELVGDRDKLIQVVINLLSNAIKFAEEGSVECRVRLVDNEIQVSVTDAGVGIAAEDQAAVFERFKQVGDTLTNKPTGTGLGLSICKEIVEHHRGRIWVESEVGRGSTFTFALPVTEARPAPDGIPRGREPRSEVLETLLAEMGSAARARRHRRKRRLLVADDDVSIRNLLRQGAEAAGYRVIEAASGRETVDLVRSEHPDLLLLDVLMPGGSGFDVTSELRSDPRTMGIPIIMLTVVEERERALRLGVDRYLPKPIDGDLLLAEVAALLSTAVSRRRVVVAVEDDAKRRALVEALTDAGHSVVAAQNGCSCVDIARQAPRPDLILVDGRLTEGTELVRLLRSEDLRGIALFVVH